MGYRRDAEIKGPPAGYQKFHLSKLVLVVGQNIALDAVPAFMASNSILTYFLPSSSSWLIHFNFTFSKFVQIFNSGMCFNLK